MDETPTADIVEDPKEIFLNSCPYHTCNVQKPRSETPPLSQMQNVTPSELPDTVNQPTLDTVLPPMRDEGVGTI